MSSVSTIYPGFNDPVHDAQACFRAVLDAFSRPGKQVPLPVLPPEFPNAAPQVTLPAPSRDTSRAIYQAPPQGPAQAVSQGTAQAASPAMALSQETLHVESASCVEAAPSLLHGAPRRGLSGPCLCGMLAVALALCDADTPLWLDPCLDTPVIRRYLAFHCGSPVLSHPEGAAFALIGDAPNMPRFEHFFAGSPEYPDRSATLIIAAFFDGPGKDSARFLTGPGISPLLTPKGILFNPGGLPDWFWQDQSMNQERYPLGLDLLFIDSGSQEDGTVRIAGLPRSTVVMPRVAAEHKASKESSACM